MKNKEKSKINKKNCPMKKWLWIKLKSKRIITKLNLKELRTCFSKTNLRMKQREKKLKDTKLWPKKNSNCGNKNSTNKSKNFNTISVTKLKLQEKRLWKENKSLMKRMKDSDFLVFRSRLLQRRRSRTNAMSCSVFHLLHSNLELETILTIELNML